MHMTIDEYIKVSTLNQINLGSLRITYIPNIKEILGFSIFFRLNYNEVKDEI